METEIYNLIKALADRDPSIKAEDFNKALGFLNRKEDPAHDPYRIILYKDVTRMLGMLRPSIEKLIKRGYLERGHVPGRKYAVGVTRESYRRLAERPVVIRPCPRLLRKSKTTILRPRTLRACHNGAIMKAQTELAIRKRHNFADHFRANRP